MASAETVPAIHLTLSEEEAAILVKTLVLAKKENVGEWLRGYGIDPMDVDHIMEVVANA